MTTKRRLAATSVVGALAASLLLPGNAHAVLTASTTDRGLFGSQDPTFDAVYRQGLAIAGLAAVDRPVPRQSVRWLLRQQCANGGFMAYRADPSQPCPSPDPTAFTGPDSNSTAMAAMALMAVGERSAARSATRYLRRTQARDGGFHYIRGGASDTNSTGLALAALQGQRQTRPVRKDRREATSYLRRAQLRCDAPWADRGLLSFQLDPMSANNLASAQGAVGLVSTLPLADGSRRIKRSTTALRCDGGQQVGKAHLRDTLLDGLNRALRRNNGMLPISLGSGPDSSATAQASIALSATGRRQYAKSVTLATRALRGQADDFTGGDAAPSAGALGTLLLAADAVDANPRRFGGVDLVDRLLSSRQR